MCLDVTINFQLTTCFKIQVKVKGQGQDVIFLVYWRGVVDNGAFCFSDILHHVLPVQKSCLSCSSMQCVTK